MKEQCLLGVRLGRGVTVLSRDKTEVSRGVRGGGECRKMGRKCLGKMQYNTTKSFDLFMSNKKRTMKPVNLNMIATN